MKLIESPSSLEKAILTKCKYETNQIIIHQDYKLMPTNKKVWSSWNVLNHKQIIIIIYVLLIGLINFKE